MYKILWPSRLYVIVCIFQWVQILPTEHNTQAAYFCYQIQFEYFFYYPEYNAFYGKRTNTGKVRVQGSPTTTHRVR